MNTSKLTAYPWLAEFNSPDTIVINNYRGVDTTYKNQKNVIYTSFGEGMTDDMLYEKLCKFSQSFVIVLSASRYSKDFESKFNCKILYIPMEYAWYNTIIPHSNIDFTNMQINKYFLSLNNRGSVVRQALFQFLTKFNLLDKFYFSYQHQDRFNEGSKNLYDRLNKIIGATWYNENVDLDYLFSQLPVSTELIDHFTGNDWSIGNVDYYQRSFGSVVTETYTSKEYNSNPFFTEKTMKPLAFGHPFLVNSSAGALVKLRELGFKTFSEIFDESYDLINNPQQRFEAILKEILRISLLDITTLEKLKKHIMPTLHENYNYFWHDWSNARTKEIELAKQEIREILY